jgi:hypothetical protein
MDTEGQAVPEDPKKKKPDSPENPDDWPSIPPGKLRMNITEPYRKLTEDESRCLMKQLNSHLKAAMANAEKEQIKFDKLQAQQQRYDDWREKHEVEEQAFEDALAAAEADTLFNNKIFTPYLH